jgi:protease-4
MIGFAYLGVLTFALIDWSSLFSQAEHRKHTALVELSGVIAPNGEASAERIVSSLQSAFDDKNTQGVILKINSPGGSPVQSGIINDEIGRLRALYPDTPLYAVVEDICASGGYYVAVAADRIYVDKASIVGSIGVLMDGFGFTGLMDKVGVERRLLTAGENKGFLDPFSPQDERHKDHARQLLGDVHQQFIEVVRKGRGERLKESPEMFSGLMWSGSRSIELGLADDLGSVEYVARDVVKAADIVDFTQRQNIAERFAKQLGADLGESVTGVLNRVGMR